MYYTEFLREIDTFLVAGDAVILPKIRSREADLIIFPAGIAADVVLIASKLIFKWTSKGKLSQVPAVNVGFGIFDKSIVAFFVYGSTVCIDLSKSGIYSYLPLYINF